jgi:hypothetical protein
MTAKHKRLTMTNEYIPKIPKIPKSYSCECGKTYVHRSSLSKHKQNCQLKNSSTTIVENSEEKPSMMEILTQNKELMNLLIVQNQEHREETSKLQNAIHEMIPKNGKQQQ